jgi:glycosyltransferase involved in cell wall biosynthesis
LVGGQRLITVLPAYNDERTLENALHEVPPGLMDEFVRVDEGSVDGTVRVVERLGSPFLRHPENRRFSRGVVCGLRVVRTSIAFRLHKWGVRKSRLFEGSGGTS